MTSEGPRSDVKMSRAHDVIFDVVWLFPTYVSGTIDRTYGRPIWYQRGTKKSHRCDVQMTSSKLKYDRFKTLKNPYRRFFVRIRGPKSDSVMLSPEIEPTNNQSTLPGLAQRLE